MHQTTITTPDARMLELIELLKVRGTIRFTQEFLDAAAIHKQNISNIRAGRQHFTLEQITKACQAYNVNANWILGLSPETFARQGKIRFISEGGGVNKKHNEGRKTALD